MNEFALASVGIVLLAAVVFVALVLASRLTSVLLTQRRRKRVLVTMKTQEAFLGVLFAVDRDALVLREVEALAVGATAKNVPVEGELLLLRADVAYIQLP